MAGMKRKLSVMIILILIITNSFILNLWAQPILSESEISIKSKVYANWLTANTGNDGVNLLTDKSDKGRWIVTDSGVGTTDTEYYILNKLADKRLRYVNTKDLLHLYNSTATGSKVRWLFIDAGDGFYYIKNKESGKNLVAQSDGSVILASSTEEDAKWNIVVEVEGPLPECTPVDDSVSMLEGTSISIDVLANDNIPVVGYLDPAHPLTPGHGTAVIEDTRIRYTPEGGFIGQDTFTYALTNGEVSTTATVYIEVLEHIEIETITLNQSQVTLYAGLNDSIIASIIPADTSSQVILTSDNPAVAEVAYGNGVITIKGISQGTAIVRINSMDNPNIYAECTVQVNEISKTLIAVTGEKEYGGSDMPSGQYDENTGYYYTLTRTDQKNSEWDPNSAKPDSYRFVKYEVARSVDGFNYEEPVTIIDWDTPVPEEGSPNGPIDMEDSLFRSNKWFRSPAGNWVIWTKRHKSDEGLKELSNFSCTTADGRYEFLKSQYPYGHVSGDLGVFREPGTDTTYLVSAETYEGYIMIYELNHDCTEIVGLKKRVAWLKGTGEFTEDESVGRDDTEHREAPSLKKIGDYYFLFTSGKTGWQPNQQMYSYASELDGQWSSLINIGDVTGYHSQVFGYPEIEGTEKTSLLFKGSRNGALWGGEGNSAIMPVYVNEPTDLSTNYYDYTVINYETGQVKGYQMDHGRKLDIVDAVAPVGEVSLSYDDDESTKWDNSTDVALETAAVTYDLGSTQLVKAVKLYTDNAQKRTHFLKIEIGDGESFTTVYDDVTYRIDWLQPINVTDCYGRYVRLTNTDQYVQNNSGRGDAFGLYECQVWGETANTEPLTLNDTSTVGVTAKNFESISGSSITLEWDMIFHQIDGNEQIQVLNGSELAVVMIHSMEGLFYTDYHGETKKICSIDPDQWYHVKMVFNTDNDTYDVYINNDMVRGGAFFNNKVTAINNVRYITGETLTVNNITVKTAVEVLD